MQLPRYGRFLIKAGGFYIDDNRPVETGEAVVAIGGVSIADSSPPLLYSAASPMAASPRLSAHTNGLYNDPAHLDSPAAPGNHLQEQNPEHAAPSTTAPFEINFFLDLLCRVSEAGNYPRVGVRRRSYCSARRVRRGDP